MVTVGPTTVELALPTVALGLVWARGGHNRQGDEALTAAISAACAGATGAEDEALTAFRRVLRHGKFRATGRSKPAHEYLRRAASEGSFPRIGAYVDALNLVSLSHAVPISLVDLARAGATAFRVRRGRAGEAYVFNAGGQSIDLEDLLLVARLPADEPIANPIKDSMATKLGPEAGEVLAVLYAGADDLTRLRAATDALAEAFRTHAGATELASALALTSGPGEPRIGRHGAAEPPPDP